MPMANEIMDEMKKKVFYSCFSGTECIKFHEDKNEFL